MLSDRVSAIELVWELIAVYGLGVCMWALTDSWVDRAARRAYNAWLVSQGLPAVNGASDLVISMNLWAASAGLALHVFFAGVGLAALLTVNRSQTLTGNAFAVGAILVLAFNATAVSRNQLARVRLRRWAREHPQQRRASDPSSADVPPPERTAPPG